MPSWGVRSGANAKVSHCERRCCPMVHRNLYVVKSQKSMSILVTGENETYEGFSGDLPMQAQSHR